MSKFMEVVTTDKYEYSTVSSRGILVIYIYILVDGTTQTAQDIYGLQSIITYSRKEIYK